MDVRVELPTARLPAHIDGPVGWMVLNNPARRNAVSLEMWEAMPLAVERCEGDPAGKAQAGVHRAMRGFTPARETSTRSASCSAVARPIPLEVPVISKRCRPDAGLWLRQLPFAPDRPYLSL